MSRVGFRSDRSRVYPTSSVCAFLRRQPQKQFTPVNFLVNFKSLVLNVLYCNYKQIRHATKDYPSDNYPSDNYPSDNHPSDNYPSDNYPSDNYPSDNYPSDNYPYKPLYLHVAYSVTFSYLLSQSGQLIFF